MDKIKGAKFFTKFDVRWGYNNVRIRTEDQWKAAFKTNQGLFRPTVMFFGMCNSPATFQSMMDSIFSDMIEECRVIVYMDDILIFANNQEDLQKHMKMVLQRLQEHDLFLKLKKCEFNKTTMEYLGLIIQEGKLSMDPVKLSGIRDWPTPNTVKQVRGFLGFANFYRQFIKKFSELVLPLNNLLQKDTKFEWNPECQEAFETLKKRFL
jgi:Reverse transcriptase (RNA-dependent DNA polymerase)